jgi:phospholipid/cholesterol/gamma-HCH transport system substrate-binding protein
MTSKPKQNTELKVGLFVAIGSALTMFSILVLGGADSIFTRTNSYSIHFSSVNGLIVGAKVAIGGLNIGTVSDVELDQKTKDIRVSLKVMRKYAQWIRKDSQAEMLTQGVLGDKFISVVAGNLEEPELPDGSEIPTAPTKDLSQFLSKGDQLMVSLNSIAASLDEVLKTFKAGKRSEIFFEGMAQSAKNLAALSSKLNEDLEKSQVKSAIRNLAGILEKINNGTGTLGALINDPGLYYDARALMGGANRNRIVRNLVRKTIQDAEAAQSDAQSDDGDDDEKSDKKRK